MTSLRQRITGSLLLGMFICVPAVWAHHAGANFDHNQRYIFKGTVKKFLWANPHSWVYLDIVKANGQSEFWGFELQGGTNMLRRAGWKSNDLKPGDTVTIQAALDRTGKRIAAMETVMTPDGRTLSAWPMGAPAPPGIAMPKRPAPAEYK